MRAVANGRLRGIPAKPSRKDAGRPTLIDLHICQLKIDTTGGSFA